MQADSLREKIAKAILEAMDITDGLDGIAADAYAEAVLAIPEIAEALLLMDTATRRFGEAGRQADPADYMSGLQNAHPWANLLKPSDLEPPSDSLSGSDRP